MGSAKVCWFKSQQVSSNPGFFLSSTFFFGNSWILRFETESMPLPQIAALNLIGDFSELFFFFFFSGTFFFYDFSAQENGCDG